MVAQRTAAEAQKPCPEARPRLHNKMEMYEIRGDGYPPRPVLPYYARRDIAGYLREGERFTVVEERAVIDGVFLRIEGNTGWVLSAARSGTFCQRMGAEADQGDGWAKGAWRGSKEQGSGSQRTWEKEDQKWNGWSWNLYPSSRGWVLCCLAKCAMSSPLLCCSRATTHVPAKSEKRRSW